MSFKIINKQILAEGVKRIDIVAPNIARKVLPGQFVSVCPEEDDEHIPLAVTSSDPQKGYISLIFPELGQTTRKLGALHINESIFSILGPLGRPARIEKKGVVVCIATGIGIAQILPICRAFKNNGSKVIGIIGAKTKKALMLEPQMRLACHKIIIATDDGSFEQRGLATEIFEKFLGQNKVDLVYAIGAVDMMRRVCSLTAQKRIETLVRVNPVMVDCMGMCGSCRVKIDGEMVLACVKGPEFDGHKVDFDDLDIRMNAYEESEEWRNRQSTYKPKRDESKILAKFLSGFQRK
ncbi:MAG: sulfide/dihydroorotate dehydrogenase-like FAD/NAD-binding protein [Candidatus Omnitrophica bacterium]|nr:sulfide/dihydroorotate dehydrogenase-like FAD/NAD-binding protein [Candidatus Omnitrophota bacterium]